MSEYEMMQWAGLAAGGVVVGAGIYGFVRFSKQLDAMWPDTAKKYGLTYTKTNEGSPWTNSKEHHALSGPSLSVSSTRERIGKTTRTSTAVVATAKASLPAMTMEVSRTRPKATLHLVTTGDAKFDGLRFVTCEARDVAARLLTPEVRAALLTCQHWTLRVTLAQGQVVVSFGQLPTSTDDLFGPIDAALALARGTPTHAA